MIVPAMSRNDDPRGVGMDQEPGEEGRNHYRGLRGCKKSGRETELLDGKAAPQPTGMS